MQDVHACPSRVHNLEGWGRPGSLLARAGKSSRGPGLAQGHPSSSKTWGAAPPGGQQGPSPRVTRSFWPPHRDKVPQELEPMALPSLSPLGNRAEGRQPHPGVWAAPALRDAGAMSACGCTRCCTHTNASLHAHSLCGEHRDSWCRAGHAPATWLLHAGAPMCLQEEVK